MPTLKKAIKPIPSLGVAIEEHVLIWPVESAALELTLIDLDAIACQEMRSEDPGRISPRMVTYMRGVTTFVFLYGRPTFKLFLKKDKRRAIIAAARVFEMEFLTETFGIDLGFIRKQITLSTGLSPDCMEMIQYLQLLAFVANWSLCDYDYQKAPQLFEEVVEMLRGTYKGHECEMRLDVALNLGLTFFDPQGMFKGEGKTHAKSNRRAARRGGLPS